MQNYCASPAVVEQILIIFRGHPWISWNGDGTDLDRSKETESELRGVWQNQQYPVLDLETEFLQGIAGAVNFLEDLLICVFAVLVVNCGVFATPVHDILVHKGCSGIVNSGQVEVHDILKAA